MAIQPLFLAIFFLTISSSYGAEQSPSVPAKFPQQVAQAATQAQSAKLISDFRLTSAVFADGQPIPDKYSCKGVNMNPPLSIHNAPEGTKSMALTVFDPAGTVGPWVHWVMFAIPPEVTEITEKFKTGIQALNDFGNFYYNGPCVLDQKKHVLVFTVYALNTDLNELTEGATMETLLKAMEGKIIAKAELTGSFRNENGE